MPSPENPLSGDHQQYRCKRNDTETAKLNHHKDDQLAEQAPVLARHNGHEAGHTGGGGRRK